VNSGSPIADQDIGPRLDAARAVDVAMPPIRVKLTESLAEFYPPTIDLRATVSGSADDPISFAFYCNRADAGTNVTTPADFRIDGRLPEGTGGTVFEQGQATNWTGGIEFSVRSVCSYTAAGSYTAKVIVGTGTGAAEARIQLPVGTFFFCGNNTIDTDEQCDSGSAVNGTPGSCCTADCHYRPAADKCQPSTAACDPEETCTGSSPDCPADVNNCTGSNCGNGTVEPPTEQCDLGSALNGASSSCCTATCQYRAGGEECHPAAGVCDIAETCSGTSNACPGDALQPADTVCRPSTAACDPQETCTNASIYCPADVNCGGRYIDNGDGTVIDTQTGLQWEKKTTAVGSGQNYADPHDVDNYYTWSMGPPWNQDGTAFTDFLLKLNTVPCFAGHCDWRLPSEEGCNSCYTVSSCPCGPNELESILLAPYPCGTYPCIDPIFGPTVASVYWSATTYADNPFLAWYVYFYNGAVNVYADDKYNISYVRAVRTGS
jgi:hypothetical protein